MGSKSDTIHGKTIGFLFSYEDYHLLTPKIDIARSMIAFDNQLANELNREGVFCREASSYLTQEDWLKIIKDSEKWIKQWPHRNFAGCTFIERLRLGSFPSLWWQMENILYGSSPHLGPGIGFYKAAKYTYIIRRILECEEPTLVYLVDWDQTETSFIKSLLSDKGVSYQTVDAPHKLSLSTFKDRLVRLIKIGHWHWLWDIRLYLRRRARGIFYYLGELGHNREKQDGLRILLVSEQGEGMRTYRDPRDNKLKAGDLYYAGIEEELLSDAKVNVVELKLGVPNVSDLSWKEDLAQILQNSEQYVPIEAFRCLKHLSISWKARDNLKKAWKDLEKDESFRKSFDIDGFDLYPGVRDQIKALLLHNAILGLRKVLAYQEALRQISPDVVLMNRHNAAMIDACRLEEIPVVEMQHGLWTPYPTHSVRYSRRCLDGEPRPLPTKIAVWGNYMSNLLHDWNCPQEHIAVTGYPAYDRLTRLESKDIKHFADELGFDSDKRIVVYMTGNPAVEFKLTPQEQLETARALLLAAKKLSDVVLIIKVHQYDEIEAYERLQSRLNAEAYSLVLKHCDTTLLIATSDAVIAKGSSTQLEAAIAGKPIIMINFSDRPDMFEFKQYDIGPYIDDVSEISNAVKTVLYDEEARKQMAEARETFVDEWANGADGRASKRLANLLKRLAREHQARLADKV